MQRNKVTILSTRTIDQQLINEIASKNIIIDAISFIKIEPTSSIQTQQEVEHLATVQATVVFTSVNAVKVVAAELDGYQPDWRIFCIGHATREAVEKFFEKNSIAGTALNAKELASAIIKKADADEVIFFCGDQRRDELIEILKAANVQVNEVIVYQTTPIPQRVDKKYDGILFFSPSAVKSFFEKNKLDQQTVLFAIGETTANELRQISGNKIIVSSKPNKENLLKEMVAYFQKNRIHH
jgi:uroporphyrinogen-III synthase